MAAKSGIGGVLIPGFGPERWPRQSSLLKKDSPLKLWGGFGWHPWALEFQEDPALYSEILERGWKTIVSTWGDQLKAVGEFGLDRSQQGQKVCDRTQETVFKLHLDWAQRLDLPVILHIVKADGAAVKALTDNPPKQGGVVHSYGSHHEMIPRYAELGLSFSYSGSLTRIPKVQESLRHTPKDRIMFETDAPQSLRQKFAKPWGPHHLSKIVEAASQILEKSVEWCWSCHRENCERVFGLHLS